MGLSKLVWLCVCLTVCMPVSMCSHSIFVRLPDILVAWLAGCLSLCDCLIVCLSVCVYPSVCLSAVRLFVCLFVGWLVVIFADCSLFLSSGCFNCLRVWMICGCSVDC